MLPSEVSPFDRLRGADFRYVIRSVFDLFRALGEKILRHVTDQPLRGFEIDERNTGTTTRGEQYLAVNPLGFNGTRHKPPGIGATEVHRPAELALHHRLNLRARAGSNRFARR